MLKYTAAATADWQSMSMRAQNMSRGHKYVTDGNANKTHGGNDQVQTTEEKYNK